MDYLFILYILIAVSTGLGGMVFLIKSDRTLGGLLFIIGSVLLFTFYGLRWFYGENLKATSTSYNRWPPYVNACPDFLTLTKDKSNKRVCIDLVGVATGGIAKFVDETNITRPSHIFNLFDNLSGQARLDALCNECKLKKVTWEGLYNGESCVPSSGIVDSKGKSETAKAQCA